MAVKGVVGWFLAVSLSLAFLAAGVTNFQSPAWELRFAAWGYPGWVRLGVGALEVLCAILLLVPRTRRWAALALTAVMLGAAVTHMLNGEAPRILVNVVLAGLLLALLRMRDDLITPESLHDRVSE